MMHIATPKLSDEAGRLAALYRYEILDTDPEHAFEDIVRVVKSVFDVPIVAISLIDADRQWFKAGTGLGVSETARSLAFCDHTIRSTAPLEVEDAAQDPRFEFNPLVTGAPGIRCYLGVPLTTPDGYNVGSLCIIGNQPRSFTPEDREVLQNFGRLVVSTMELRLLARRDLLTGALSRRAFEERLREVVSAPAPTKLPMTLLMLDLDHFKSVNDRFGHPTGDLVLAAVADAIRTCLRPADRLGRLGGEEFGVLLTDIGPNEAYTLATRIRKKVEKLSLPCLEGQRISLSCGMAHWQEQKRKDVIGWITAADIALYAAKRYGRNRVELAGAELRGNQVEEPPSEQASSALARFSASDIAERLRQSHGRFPEPT